MEQVSEISNRIEQLVSSLQQQGFLDEQFSQLLMLQDDSNPDFVAELTQLYFDDSIEKINRMELLLAAEAPNYTELDQIVHQFKGSSASLGARSVCQLCVSMREGCQSKDKNMCQCLLQQVRAAYSALRQELEVFTQLEAQRKAILAGGPGS